MNYFKKLLQLLTFNNIEFKQCHVIKSTQTDTLNKFKLQIKYDIANNNAYREHLEEYCKTLGYTVEFEVSKQSKPMGCIWYSKFCNEWFDNKVIEQFDADKVKMFLVIIVKTPFNSISDYDGNCTKLDLLAEMRRCGFIHYWTFNWSDLYFVNDIC